MIGRIISNRITVTSTKILSTDHILISDIEEKLSLQAWLRAMCCKNIHEFFDKLRTGLVRMHE